MRAQLGQINSLPVIQAHTSRVQMRVQATGFAGPRVIDALTTTRGYLCSKDRSCSSPVPRRPDPVASW